MRRLILTAAGICLLAPLQLRAQVVAPPEVTASAVAAVEALGKQVVLGNHQVAIDRMYPRWKDSVAKREGGMAKLEAKLAGIGKMMSEQGVLLRSFRPEGKPIAYEVGSGKEVVEENGRQVERMTFNQWLILIPTVTEYRITPPAEKEHEQPKSMIITTKSFQVAISDKGENDWTFIDGSSATVPDLRRLFFTLPDTMKLPPIERKSSEVK